MTAEPITLTTAHTCTCNHDEAETIVLDGRTIPHAVRHAAIFGALESIQPGFSLDLIAPHDPLPLLAQLEKARPGAFTVSYVERGPEAWRIRFTRAA
ncbi:DUF2249 domain-containing protein [Cryobacterium cryoconiti]|uniref:DUF2249 domain-containing protein n=1 Tax=Cryobacterium cryoconiti TaxID=1259239 RepID=A0A4Y8JXB2_9MICO|nr:DUF2249 domain-containing protein [Cryobacterium cryoconiti]TFD33027.1 DUF2249 domain-containing protein [Cryobacterium cryoconiti]